MFVAAEVPLDLSFPVAAARLANLAPGGWLTGPGGGLFHALDADISRTPIGEHSTRLSLAGVYRPPLAVPDAGLDKALFHKVADATVRSRLARVADVLARPPEPPGVVQGTGMTGAATRRAATGLS